MALIIAIIIIIVIIITATIVVVVLLGRVEFRCLSVSPSVRWQLTVYCGKTANFIEMPFLVVNRVGPSNNVLDGRAQWRHLANTVERLRGG